MEEPPALKKKFMFCYCNEICKFMLEGRCTSVPLYHTVNLKASEVTYNALVSAFSVMIHDTRPIGKIAVYMAIYYSFRGLFGKSRTSLKQEVVFY